MPQTTSTTQAPATTPRGEPIPHPEGVSNDEFRAAMSRLTAGVTLVTAHDADGGPRGEDVGMTATAFMSVSLDPPLVMVSVRNGSRMDDLLAEQPMWAVSLLSESQRQIAGRFSMKARLSDRLLFADIAWTRGAVSGSPLVGGALATLECRTEQRVEAGDHTLVIGRVLEVGLPGEDDSPLTYFKGNYRKLG
ncbi:flavin reductase family protein [Streptomyces sp. 21So2-11]|uniref:flavin reductase family protein n=1 Tax=Streptomyces sp. 21So2-11 TaxID=3144408 RepID=UPI00321BD0BF